jgi:tryptophan-rich sensory protein
MLAYVAWSAVRSGSDLAGPAIAIWAFQIALNAIWTPFFFGLRRPGVAFFVILCLWITVAVMVLLFGSIASYLGWMLFPYLIWVSYAGALNYAVWKMNPTGAWQSDLA